MQTANEQDEIYSPVHKQVNDTREPRLKLKQLLRGSRIEELQLDFIATQHFDNLYILDAILGAGAFGVVLQVIDRSSGEELAMKLLSKRDMNPHDIEALINEAKMLARIDHSSIVKLKRVHESGEYVFLVMELVKAGTLKAFIKYRKLKSDPIKDSEASLIMRQILEGVAYIHQLNIVHRDLKPQNILMRSFHQLEGAVRIADFGLGMQDSDTSTDGCGTMVYMAPEQLTKSLYRKEVDIWAAGIIMYMLLAGEHPLYTKADTKETYTAKMLSPKFAFPPAFSDLAKDLCTRLCDVNVDSRYCGTTALKHPWITREFDKPIPLTIYEEDTRKQVTIELTQLLRAVIFLAEIATPCPVPELFVQEVASVDGDSGEDEEEERKVKRAGPRANSTAPESDGGKDIVVRYRNAKDYNNSPDKLAKKGTLKLIKVNTKRDLAVGTPGLARRLLTTKEMQEISRKTNAAEKSKPPRPQMVSPATSPPARRPPPQPLSGRPPNGKVSSSSLHSRGNTQKRAMVKSPSVAALQKTGGNRRAQSLHGENEVRPEVPVVVPTIKVKAPRSATMKKLCVTDNCSSGLLKVASGTGMCITPRLPPGTNMAGNSGKPTSLTFVGTQELDRILRFTAEQKQEFAEIEGMQKMKSRRNLLAEGDGKSGRLKPIDKLQRFTVGSPVVSKGNHKYFK